jgi:hypothetical protein
MSLMTASLKPRSAVLNLMTAGLKALEAEESADEASGLRYRGTRVRS